MPMVRLLVALALLAACAAPAQPTPTPAQPTPTLTPAPAPPTTPPTPTAQPTQGDTPSPGPGETVAPTGQPSPAPSPTPVALPDVVAWTRLEPPDGPSARDDHTWTVDPDGEVAYLFGGRAGRTALDDTWAYDLASDTWTRLDVAAAPPARWGHVAAWHDSLGLVIWSGQASASAFFEDIWAFDPVAAEWQQLPSSGAFPIARYGSCGGIGPDGRLWISHGFTHDEGRFRDTRAYNFVTGEWADVTPGTGPVERCLHDCFWAPDGRLILYAGQTTGLPALGDLWAYDPQTNDWAQEPTPPPAARQLYAVAVFGDVAYVFGGGAVDGSFLGDLWRLSLADLDWTELSGVAEGPVARSGATLIADVARSRLVLFGGQDRSGVMDDLWSLGAPGG